MLQEGQYRRNPNRRRRRPRRHVIHASPALRRRTSVQMMGDSSRWNQRCQSNVVKSPALVKRAVVLGTLLVSHVLAHKLSKVTFPQSRMVPGHSAVLHPAWACLPRSGGSASSGNWSLLQILAAFGAVTTVAILLPGAHGGRGDGSPAPAGAASRSKAITVNDFLYNVLPTGEVEIVHITQDIPLVVAVLHEGPEQDGVVCRNVETPRQSPNGKLGRHVKLYCRSSAILPVPQVVCAEFCDRSTFLGIVQSYSLVRVPSPSRRRLGARGVCGWAAARVHHRDC